MKKAFKFSFFLAAVFLAVALFHSVPATHAQDVESKVETNRQLIQSLYDQQKERELNLYGYVSSSWYSEFQPSSDVTTRNHFEAGRFALFADKQLSDRVRISGEIFFQNGASSGDTSFFSPSTDAANKGIIEASYYFLEYDNPTFGQFRAGKLWKPTGMLNEIGNNVPAITTIRLPGLYGEPGSITYGFRTGAGVQYKVPSHVFENPFVNVDVKLQADNGSDEEQYSSDQNDKQTYSGRVTFGLKNPSVIGLDSFKLSYSHDWNRPAAPPGEQNNNIIYTGVELSKGPVLFRAEHQDGYIALQDFTVLPPPQPYVEEHLDLYYGTLYVDATSNLTTYARYESQQFGQVLGYLDHSSYTLGMNYNLDVLTLKGEYHKQTYDGNIPRTGPFGITYDEDNQVRLQAVASF